jgi:glycosyltransferase involved in cell wall biosynthesis
VELTILMPCLNEAETVATCVRKARGFLERMGIDGEVLVADNGSTDGSPELALKAGARVVPVAQKGYGSALMGGINAANGRFVIMADADDSYDFSQLDAFVEGLRAGNAMVIGHRFRGGIRRGAMPVLHRYLGNPVLSFAGRLLFSSRIGDFHCGLRGVDRAALLQLGLRAPGMEFASEMIVKATLARWRIAEVPTVLSPDGRSRAPHLRSWRDGWRHLRFMLLFSPRWLFLIPGLLLMLLGGAGIAVLWRGDLAVGSIHLGVHTMLYAAVAVAAGFQAVTFSFFTKIFAISEGLLPEDPRLTRLFRHITLESGLAVGFAFLLLGAAGTLDAFAYWGATTFGQLDPAKMLRLVIPAAFTFLLGWQVVLASLFLSVLGLRVRRVLEAPK